MVLSYARTLCCKYARSEITSIKWAVNVDRFAALCCCIRPFLCPTSTSLWATSFRRHFPKNPAAYADSFSKSYVPKLQTF